MGEYLSIKGEHVKLGTCEDLFSVRLEQLRALRPSETMKLEGNLDLKAYLDPKSKFRYRFPFPDEDGFEIGSFEDLERGYIVHLYPDLAPTILAELGTWGHYEISHACNINHAYNVNVSFPCVLSDKFPTHDSVLKRSSNGASKVVEVVAQRQVDDEVWTVIRCGYCHAMVRLDKAGASEIAACLRKDAPKSIMAERVMAGYKAAAAMECQP